MPSVERIGRDIYPLRILGFYSFAISIFLSQSNSELGLDLWGVAGIAICLVYPHVAYVRYLRNENRDIEINHMLFDMVLLGVMTALVSFTPMIALPILVANSAANFALRGAKQSIKGGTYAALAAIVIGLLRNEDIVLHANLIEIIGPFFYLTVVIHYMGYLAYTRGIKAHERGITLIQRRKKAERVAKLDFLTGLNNRRSMYVEVKQNDEKLKARGHDTTLIMVDLDHFKQINDQHGHDHGDAVLVRISELMKNSLRGTDIVARWGGEEFLVLLPKTNIEQGLGVAETIRQNIANSSINYDGIDHHVTATLGIASYGAESNFQETILRADNALYKGKQQGRNCVVVGSEPQPLYVPAAHLRSFIVE